MDQMKFALQVTGGWLAETVIKNLLDQVWNKMNELGSQGGEGGEGAECGVEDALSNLEISLTKIQPAISKAENMWIKDEHLRGNVNKLLLQLKDVTYDAEDLMDKFQFQKLQQQIKKQGNEASDTPSSSFLSFLRRPVKKRKVGKDNNHDNVTKIKKIQEKLDNINNAMKELLDSDNNRGKVQMINEINRVTSSIPVETQVFGRDNELNELIRLLLEPDQGGSSSGSGNSISILTITGMGGVGKTTVAQKAYNDKRVEEYFELRIWVCVSEDFSVERLTKEIIESANQQIGQSNESTKKQKCDLQNFDALQMALKKRIASKKYLLVLDDVWSKDKHIWDSLCAPLRSGVTGSKILVTTRDENIANMVGSVNPIHLNCLDDDNCWEFFKKCAFGSRNSRDHPRLEAIAQEMVPKLKGLPLAVRTLGGLLNMNVNEQEWKTIMESEIWELQQEENGVLLVLQLSYHYLPSYLKRCFAFCSLYPKDYRFDKDEFVLIWMAEGFFPAQKNITTEDFGSGCFQELVSRSFFQKSQNPNVYVMHDLMHDLAQLISEGETYRLEDGKPFEIPTTLRHLNIVRIEADGELRRMMEFYDFSKLRTFICRREYRSIKSMLTCGFFNRLQSIHTLDLSHCDLRELPEGIGDFKHLRYLDIINNREITKLPDSLFHLYNLQTLNLACCDLRGLPDSVGNLIYLRYLDISLNKKFNKLPESLCRLSSLQTLGLGCCFRLEYLPQGMSRLISLRKLDAEDHLVSKITGVGKLTSLQSLSVFKVGKEHGQKLVELSGLTQLHGTLRIMSLENVESKEEAIAAELQSKLHLDGLVLQWTSDRENDTLYDSDELVLKHLQLNSTIDQGYDTFSDSEEEVQEHHQPNSTSDQDNDALSDSEEEVHEHHQPNSTSDQDSDAFSDSEEEVLEHLQPNSTLKRLTISGYSGDSSPSWLEAGSLSKLEILSLKDCERWDDLSFIRKLSNLKSLLLKRLPAVKQIRRELFGSTASNSFLELEKVVLEDMMSLEGLAILGQFPRLKSLRLRGVPHLEIEYGLRRGPGQNWFPSLEVLELQDTESTELPLLVQLPSLKILRIGGMPEVKEVAYGFFGFTNHLTCFPTLEELKISTMPVCQAWSCSDDREWFPCLRVLEIDNCPLLKKLPLLPSSLTRLTLNQVGLIEFPGIQDGIGGSSSNITSSRLVIKISYCPNLTSLDQMECFPSLKYLTIQDCPLLTRLPPLPFSLVKLRLIQVGLTELPGIVGSSSNMTTVSLLNLHIEKCSNMISLEQGLMSYNLPELLSIVVTNCKELLRMPVKKLKESTKLDVLKISDCPKLMSMARDDDIHLLLPPSIRRLELSNCGEISRSLADPSP